MRREGTVSTADGSKWRAFDEVVHGRRAVRDFSRERVAERDMNDLIDAAILAPTSSNLQPFELVWVRSLEAKQKLVHACMSQPAAKSAAELVVCIARWDRCDDTRQELAKWMREHHMPRKERFYYDHLVKVVYDQGPFGLYGRARKILLSPLASLVPMPRGPTSVADTRVWAVKSATLACENFMLAARAKNLDTCPIEGCDPLRVGKIVGLSRWQWKHTWDLVMVIAIGHRAKNARIAPQWRRDRSALVREI